MPRGREKHTPYFNLLDALDEKHCPICSLCRKAVTGYCEDLLYEKVNDGGVRAKILKAGGFCGEHSWQMVSLGDPLGNAIILEALIRKALQERSFEKGADTRGDCPACIIWGDTEKRYCDIFVDNFKETGINLKFQSSFGFCVPHFRIILCSLKKEERKEFMKIEMEKWAALAEELSQFKEKFHYQSAGEHSRENSDVWIRAVELLKGRKDLMSG